MTDRTDQIRERAHQIWEEQGRPEGHELEHWHEAERQLLHEGLSAETVHEGDDNQEKALTVKETAGAPRQKPAPGKP